MPRFAPLAVLLLSAVPAFADGPPPPSSMVAHLEIVTPQRSADHAISIAPDGESGRVDADGPGRSVTHVKMWLHTRGGAGVAFEVEHVAEDKTSWSARGDVPPPAPGKKVVVARVPQAGGDVELRLSLTPAHP